MRILHVITSLRTGGAEKLMVDLLPRLKQRGHEVDLLLFDGTDTPFRRAAEAVGDDDESFVVVLAVDPAGQQVFAGEEADFPPGIRLLHLLIERKRAGRLRFNAHEQERINNVRGRDGTGDVHHKQNQKENFQFLFHGACSFFKKIAQ